MEVSKAAPVPIQFQPAFVVVAEGHQPLMCVVAKNATEAAPMTLVCNHFSEKDFSATAVVCIAGGSESSATIDCAPEPAI